MKHLFFTSAFLCALILPNIFLGATATSLSNGNWENVATWDIGRLPTDGDTIVIDPAHTVTVTTNNTTCNGAPATHVFVKGSLTFTNGDKLNLGCGSSLTVEAGGQILPGSGGGSSKKILICGAEMWNSSMGTITGPVVYGTPLPIELGSFSAICSEGKTQIAWTTVTETNNDYFEIERSADGRNFHVIAKIDGAGNSSMHIEYFELDQEPIEGISYYRLSQTDYDGKTEKFGIVPVKCLKPSESAISLFPNPVSADDGEVNLLLEGFQGEEVLVMLRDITGKEFYSKLKLVQSGNNLEAIPIDMDVPSGTYLVIASSNNSIYSKMLIVTNSEK